MTNAPASDEMIRSLKAIEAEWLNAGRSLAAVLPREMAGAINLMTYPASVLSASAIAGVGAAGHMAGLWMNAWIGAVEGAQRGMNAAAAPQPAGSRARATAAELIADANSLAEEISRPVAVTKRAAPRRSAKPSRETITADQANAMPVAAPKPAKPDDLKAIGGVGPKLEQVLNRLGIWTYAQIAELSPAEIDWIEDYLSFKGRIGRDDWLGQAKRLAAGKGL